GIRDFHVTGVQTCALPISFFSDLKMVVIENLDGLTRYDDKVLSTFYKYLESPSSDIVLILTITELPKDHNLGSYLEKYTFIETRSEERRVGKECRYCR